MPGRGAARFLPPQERRKGGDAGGAGLRGSCLRRNDGKAGMPGARGCEVPASAGTTERRGWRGQRAARFLPPQERRNAGVHQHGGGSVEVFRQVAAAFGRRGVPKGMEDRAPPGQYVTPKMPVMSMWPTPRIDLDMWRLRLFGDVERERELTWAEWESLAHDRSDGGLPLRHAVEQAERRLGGRSGVAGAGPRRSRRGPRGS